MIDLGIQLKKAKEANATNQNETGRLLGNIARKATELLNKSQSGGQRTDILDKT